MAVAHRASAAFNETDGTTGGTITIPATVQAGDDLYVQVESRGGGTTVTCTDDDATGNLWTKLGDIDGILWLFWKKATAATASKTVTIAGAVNSCAGGLSAFSGGLASGDPTTNLTFENNTTGAKVHNAFTPTAADSMICFGHCHFTASNEITDIVCTDPGSLEPELWQAQSTGGSDCTTIFAVGLQVGGPTDTGNITWLQVTNSTSRSLAFAIQPEPPAVGVTAAIAQTLPSIETAAAVTSTVDVQASQILPVLGQSATTASTVTAALGQILPAIAQAASASIGATEAQIAQTLPTIGQAMIVQLGELYDLHIDHGGPRTGWRSGRLSLRWRTGGPVKT